MADEHAHHHTLSYVDAVNAFRADKDAFFKTSEGSPIPAAEREAFSGLPYYPVDERMVIDDLALHPYTGNEPVQFEIPRRTAASAPPSVPVCSGSTSRGPSRR